MPKRGRDEPNANVYPLPPDPLKSVSKSLAAIAEDRNFSVCDLVVVLEEMSKLFETSVVVTGPCEGSINLMNIPVSSWITDKKKRECKYSGLNTELRFSLSKESDELLFVQRTLDLCFCCRKNPNINRMIVLNCDDDANSIKDRIMSSRKPLRYDYTDDQVVNLLAKPMPLCLRANYPHYTWPCWAFGAFHAFVARRIQLKK